jgi:tetratricopeptide (TPR) repeat protein
MTSALDPASLPLPERLARALALYRRGKLLRAQALCEEIIDINPRAFDAMHLLGVIALQTGNLAKAVALLGTAVDINPDCAEAHCSRGVALQRLKRWDEALASYDQAIALRPDYAKAYNNRGLVLHAMKRWDAALESYQRAVSIDSNCAGAYANRAALLHELNRLDEALSDHNRALEITPDFAGARQNRAYTLLLQGDLEKGWIDHEWRWQNDEAGGLRERRHFKQPLWLGGEPIAGRTILLHSEQGLGDTLQFCRYAKLVADLGARVILEVPSPLKTLLASLEGAAQVVATDEALPAFDCYCPLMSLPLAFKTTLANIPARIPYLRSRVDKVLHWRARLGKKTKLRVGLVWSGGFRPHQPELWAVNERRNIPLAQLAALNDPNVEFYSLQKGEPAQSEAAELRSKHWNGPALIDHTNQLLDFSDTAALIENLDLVISVDTATAHLAGALGKPVWILNRFDSCWRWLLDRSDSPWYPTVRLYRQEQPGDWDGVVQRVRNDLTALVGAFEHP